MLKSEILAAEYRGRAQQALTAAEASPLQQVRLKHQSAASVWQGLAELQDRCAAHTQATAARLAAPAPLTRAAPAPGDTGDTPCIR
jgi:hypothetical protein